MKENLQVLAVHAACVFVICVCFYLAELTPLRTVTFAFLPGPLSTAPILSRALECAGFLTWGKLGFKPAEAIVERMIANMSIAQVTKVLSVKPPAQLAAVANSINPPVVLEPVPKPPSIGGNA